MSTRRRLAAEFRNPSAKPRWLAWQRRWHFECECSKTTLTQITINKATFDGIPCDSGTCPAMFRSRSSEYCKIGRQRDIGFSTPSLAKLTADLMIFTPKMKGCRTFLTIMKNTTRSIILLCLKVGNLSRISIIFPCFVFCIFACKVKIHF